MATTYTLISSNVLSGSAASVTFSSIPSTYTDLVLKYSARSDYSNYYEWVKIVLNNDTTTNYSETYINGTGSAANSNRTSSDNYFERMYGATANTATSNTFGNTEVYIPNYTSTSAKPLSSFGTTENNATGAYINADAMLYRGSSGITRIDISPALGTNWLSGSSFYLYGIKNS